MLQTILQTIKTQAPIYWRAFAAVIQLYFWVAILIVLYTAIACKLTVKFTVHSIRNSYYFLKEAYWHKFNKDREFEVN